MAARGDLRHNAAVYGMQVCLRKNLIRQYFSSVLHDGNSRLITGGLKRKNFHVSLLPC